MLSLQETIRPSADLRNHYNEISKQCKENKEGGYISWYDFAKEIFRQAGMDVTVNPVSSDAYPAKAKRPANSRLEKKKLDEHGFDRLPTWQDALSRYLKEIEF